MTSSMVSQAILSRVMVATAPMTTRSQAFIPSPEVMTAMAMVDMARACRLGAFHSRLGAFQQWEVLVEFL